jgi:3D-(3,5/4)-trihydroxycyclohexane-1,2-dione acylhydrolase (decyclizing)
VKHIGELEAALQRARAADRTYLISIDTDAARTTDDGGWWWEVAVPEVSQRAGVRDARSAYEAQLAARDRAAGPSVNE